ncbi:MAG: hypothetical protein IPP59_09270 [Betaproteobacteria bacterium]|nr:hypothetical protein [Candidatus Dechloromonas phosphorivorans]
MRAEPAIPASHCRVDQGATSLSTLGRFNSLVEALQRQEGAQPGLISFCQEYCLLGCLEQAVRVADLFRLSVRSMPWAMTPGGVGATGVGAFSDTALKLVVAAS